MSETAELDRAMAKCELLSPMVGRLRLALDRLLDVQDEECRWDHNGKCQAHYLDGGGRCRVANARELQGQVTEALRVFNESPPVAEPSRVEDSWRRFGEKAIHVLWLMVEDALPFERAHDEAEALFARRDALLAAEDEHPALPVPEALNALSNFFDDLRQRSAEDEHPATPDAHLLATLDEIDNMDGPPWQYDHISETQSIWFDKGVSAAVEAMRAALVDRPPAPVDEHPPTGPRPAAPGGQGSDHGGTGPAPSPYRRPPSS